MHAKVLFGYALWAFVHAAMLGGPFFASLVANHVFDLGFVDGKDICVFLGLVATLGGVVFGCCSYDQHCRANKK